MRSKTILTLAVLASGCATPRMHNAPCSPMTETRLAQMNEVIASTRDGVDSARANTSGNNGDLNRFLYATEQQMELASEALSHYNGQRLEPTAHVYIGHVTNELEKRLGDVARMGELNESELSELSYHIGLVQTAAISTVDLRCGQ